MTAQDLKNSILQLAVEGKLVPQDPSDEPVSELLKRIKSFREAAIKNGTLSVDKKHTADPITENDIPYDLPSSWAWVRFADIVTFNSGKTPARQDTASWSNGVCPWVSIADMVADGVTFDTKEKVSAKAISESFSDKISPAGTMIMSFKLTIGKMSTLGIDAVHNEAIISIFPTVESKDEDVIKAYLFKILPLVAITGDSKNAVKGKTLNATSISNLMIPLPPIAEQERIVARIEELLPLINEYDEAEKRLTSLNAEFPDKLRKSILQQAVQGKLTERDPADEPASELLKRICVEKAKLIAKGKIKKEKPLPPITDEEKPFEIPDTWAWERIGNLFSVIRGSSPRPKGSPLYWSSKETEFHWVTIKDISDHTQNGVMYKTHEHLTELGSTLSTYVEKGELVVAVSGSTTGKFCILGINGFIYDGLAAVLNPMKIISGEYLKVFYSWVYQILNSKKIGSAFPNINTDVLKNTLIPIPPLEEQQRIVARVEELLAVCDGLK